MPVHHQACIGGIVNTAITRANLAERQAMPEQALDVLRRVAQNMEPSSTMQQVCDHPAQIIELQEDITDHKSAQILPPKCDHTEIEN